VRLEDYPKDSWRKNQRDYARAVLYAARTDGPRRIGLEGPCGSGKSIGYLRGLLAPGARPSMVLTTTRQHLRQLEDTLNRHWPGSTEWAILRGRSFYTCCGSSKAPRKTTNFITEEDHDPKADWTGEEDAQGAQAKGRCPLKDDCQYRRAVEAAASATVVVQCTVGGLYRKRYWGELEVPDKANSKQSQWVAARRAVVDRPVVVLDEAHEYLRVRRDFETKRAELWLKGVLQPHVVEALQAARKKPGGYVAGYVLLEAGTALRAALDAEFDRLLAPATVEQMMPAGRHLDNRDKIRETWVQKLKNRQEMVRSGDVVSVQWSGYKCELVEEPLYAGVKEPLAEVEIFTSATLADVAPLLGIPSDGLTCYPEIFDWAGKVTCNPLPEMKAVDGPMLRQIFDAPGRPLTVVLFLSKAQTEAATKGFNAPGLYVQSAQDDLSELVESIRLKSITCNSCNGKLNYYGRCPDCSAPPAEEDDEILF
jgi:hypothetical protein